MEPFAISLRPARLEEAGMISQLVNSAYRGDSSRKGWTTEADLLGGQRTDEDAIKEMIGSEGRVLLVCFRGQQLTGCVFLKRKDLHAYLGMLTVKPDCQAGGIGKQLLQQAEEWACKNWQVTTIEMTVIRQRKELIAWYERRGYKPTGQTESFPMHDPRFGIPKVNDLEFLVLEKQLVGG